MCLGHWARGRQGGGISIGFWADEWAGKNRHQACQQEQDRPCATSNMQVTGEPMPGFLHWASHPCAEQRMHPRHRHGVVAHTVSAILPQFFPPGNERRAPHSSLPDCISGLWIIRDCLSVILNRSCSEVQQRRRVSISPLACGDAHLHLRAGTSITPLRLEPHRRTRGSPQKQAAGATPQGQKEEANRETRALAARPSGRFCPAHLRTP